MSAPARRPARDRALAVEGEQAPAGRGVRRRARDPPRARVRRVPAARRARARRARGARRWRRGRPGSSRGVRRRDRGKREFFVEAERALLGGRGRPAGDRALATRSRPRIASVYPHAKPRTFGDPQRRRLATASTPRPSGRAARRSAARLHLPQIAYVGLLLAHSPRLKGLEAVLEAWRRSRRSRDLDPEFHLLVAGQARGSRGDARSRARTGSRSA